MSSTRGLRTLAPALAIVLAASVSQAGTLFIGADTEDFAQTLPDRLGVADVSASVLNSLNIIPLDFFLNGLADAGGYLLAGTPSANTLNSVAFDGTLLGSIAAPGIPNSGCCNEEMLFVPNAGGGADTVYHAHFNDAIRQIDPATGMQLDIFPQSDVVGMALVGTDIWISKWSAQQVGIWDPVTNMFTPKFNVPSNAGGLAYDPINSIMWVGRQGGWVEPYSLTGSLLNDGFQPFGNIGDTIDGLTFLGEVTPTPEPGSMLLLGAGLSLVGLLRRRQS
jgi:PEP-CTERM motif